MLQNDNNGMCRRHVDANGTVDHISCWSLQLTAHSFTELSILRSRQFFETDDAKNS
jgi:hypothetical protein